MIDEYLRYVTQNISYNGSKSSEFLATSGFPQRSNLGQLIFNIYMNVIIGNLPMCQKKFKGDDVLCTYRFSYTPNNESIPRSSSFKDLGVTFDYKLSKISEVIIVVAN